MKAFFSRAFMMTGGMAGKGKSNQLYSDSWTKRKINMNVHMPEKFLCQTDVKLSKELLIFRIIIQPSIL